MSSQPNQNPNSPIFVLTQQHLSLVALYSNGKSLREISDLTMIAYTTVRRRLDDAKLKARAENLAHLVAMCVADGSLVRGPDGFQPSLDFSALE